MVLRLEQADPLSLPTPREPGLRQLRPHAVKDQVPYRRAGGAPFPGPRPPTTTAEAALAWLASGSPTWWQRASHGGPAGTEGGEKSHEELVNPWNPRFPAAGTRRAVPRGRGPPPAQAKLRCAASTGQVPRAVQGPGRGPGEACEPEAPLMEGARAGPLGDPPRMGRRRAGTLGTAASTQPPDTRPLRAAATRTLPAPVTPFGCQLDSRSVSFPPVSSRGAAFPQGPRALNYCPLTVHSSFLDWPRSP